MRADLKEWMLKTSEELQGLGSKVLLWTNPSPTAAFGAQTVISNTDLTIYDEIEIYYAGNTDYPDCIHVAKQPANTNSYIFGSSNSLTARNVVITDTSLSFGKGVRYAYAGNGSDDNAQLIPQKIYGVIIGATGGGGSGGGTSDYEDLENKPTINGVTLVEGLVTEDLNLGDTAHEEISQADFDALTSEEQNDGTVYFITDGVASNIFVDDNVPVGTIAPYGGSNDPAYWLICDGRAISRTAYSELFSVIGTTYGTGDGSTTFNIPDLRGNIAIGASEDYELGDSGGEETHTLTVNEMPSHTHKTQGIAYQTQSYSTNPLNYVLADLDNSYRTEFMMPAGGGQAHNNMQPYVVTNYIVKAKTALSENQSQLDFFYPVGSYYETSDSTFNPNSRWGGTWAVESISDDIVVEEGTSGIWTYRKWESGVAECWGIHTGSYTTTNTWGSTKYASFTTQTLPITFISKPSIGVSVNKQSGSGMPLISFVANSATDISGYINEPSGNQYTYTVDIGFIVKGLWQTYDAPNIKYKWHRVA